jgi:serine/threonine protein kinase
LDRHVHRDTVMTGATGRTELREGLVIDDHVRLDERIGEGAVGDVWRATHLELESPVAVKVATPRATRGGESCVARFLNETTLARRVDCEHVIRVLECRLSLDVGPYIVMDLVEGLDLFEHVARTGPLAVVEVATVVAQLCVALDALHAANVLHRDVKPENIVLATRGGRMRATLVDFGVAVDARAGVDAAEASIAGTPAYMSPERLGGTVIADARDDLWSLAVVAYQCLVGRMPFDDTRLETLVAEVDRATFFPPSTLRADVPPALDVWFDRSFARAPAGRFPSAALMREALIDACSPLPLESPSYRWEAPRRGKPRDSECRPIQRTTSRRRSVPTRRASSSTGSCDTFAATILSNATAKSSRGLAVTRRPAGVMTSATLASSQASRGARFTSPSVTNPTSLPIASITRKAVSSERIS